MKFRCLPLQGAAIALTLIVSACGKTDDVKPNGKTALLTAGTWKMSTYTMTSGTVTIDYFQELGCLKDNTLLFNADNTLKADEGAVKCSSDAAQSYTSTWKFLENDTQIEIEDRVYTIQSLTGSELHVSITTSYEGTVKTIENIVMVH